MNKINEKEKKIRNNVFYLVPRRMKISKKLCLTGILTFLILYLVYTQTKGFLTNYIYLELVFVGLLIFILSIFVEYVDYKFLTKYFMKNNRQMMIGYSNLVTIYDDDYTISRMYNTDEIRFKKVSGITLNDFYPLKTTVVECYKNGELKTCIGIRRQKGLEGTVLHPNKENEHKDVFSLKKCDGNCEKCSDKVFCENCEGNCEICSMKVFCESCKAECEICPYKELCDFCDGDCFNCSKRLDCPSCMSCCERCEYADKCNHKNHGMDIETYDSLMEDGSNLDFSGDEIDNRGSEIISGDSDLSGSLNIYEELDDEDHSDDSNENKKE